MAVFSQGKRRCDKSSTPLFTLPPHRDRSYSITLSRASGLLLLLLIPRPDLEPDRASDKSEVLANLVAEKSLEREMHLDVLIGEQHKRRRSHRGLCHVINPHPLVHRHRSLLEVHLLQKQIHLPGGHALP